LRSISGGSLHADLDLSINLVQGVLPVIATLSPSVLWEYTKATFAFLKVVFQAAHQGVRPTYSVGVDNSVTVSVGDIHHHYNAPVLQVGRQAIEPYRRFQALIDDGSVTSIALSAERDGTEDVALSLTSNDRGLFEVPSTVAEEPIDVRCEIFDFNKYQSEGRAAVTEGQPIPAGRYRFRVIGNQDSRVFIESMLEPSVTLRCLTELRIDPVGETTIARLHVLGVGHAA
jgi:hypothetical protein